MGQSHEDVAHGTALGFRAGCRSRGGCPLHQSATLLTCVEAEFARRGDYAIARLPIDEPVARVKAVATPQSSRVQERPRERRESMRNPRTGARVGKRASSEPPHGTTARYLRGCRSSGDCPRNADDLSCVEARNAARRNQARRRGVPAYRASVDATQVARVIRTLPDTGVSLRQFAKKSGVGRTTVAGLANGSVPRVHPDTLARLARALDAIRPAMEKERA
ncbi:helix-turn-helix domain-containing protein [Microbacterium yannicii]|uniref:helix-turn-helix domain-containing protein n=2 Tax=Microbacterium yannicii TaxID=671622 RepID=UPI003D6A39BE